MNRKKLAVAALSLVAAWTIPCAAQKATQPDDEEVVAPKARPAPRETGFKAPETVAPTPTQHQQKDTNFQPPETLAPSGARPEQQVTNFKMPDTVTAQELPVRTGATEAISSGANPLMGSARARLQHARNATDFRVKGSQPFRMHAVLSGMMDTDLESGGTYTELWLAPTRWRREAAVGPVHVIESRDGDKLYRKIEGREYAPRLLDDLMDALYLTYPPLGSSFIEADWQQGSVLYEGKSALRVSTGLGANGAQAEARAYWLSAEEIPIAAYSEGATVEYADYEAWNDKQVSRHLNLKQDGTKVAGIWIDQLEAAPSESGAQFALDGVTPIPLSDAGYSGPYFVPPHPVHQVSPNDPPAGEGVITIAVHLDAYGHVRSVKVQKGINGALDAAAVKAAMQWEFAPALVKGRPIPTEAAVEFRF